MATAPSEKKLKATLLTLAMLLAGLAPTLVQMGSTSNDWKMFALGIIAAISSAGIIIYREERKV